MRTVLHIIALAATLLVAANAAAQQPFDLDPSFQAQLTEQYVSSLALDLGGELLVSGRLSFTDLEETRRNARINASGVRDASYYTSGLGGGKIVTWNEGQCYIGTDQTVRRLTADGTQDPTFIEMNADPYFSSLQGGDYHVFPDGRVLMSGAHQLNDPTRGFVGLYNLIWFTNTGYLDTTRTHRYSNGNMFEFEALPDGKFIGSTQGTTYEQQAVSKLFRIDEDGSLDPGFTTALANWGWCQAIEPLADGRILTGGTYRLGAETDTLCLVRLMANGTLDPEFHIAEFKNTTLEGTPPFVNDILVLDDGRIVVTGNFDTVDGQMRLSIAMLNADGSLSDDAFVDAGCGVFNYMPVSGGTFPQRRISGIVPAPDGSYYIHGSYRGYNDGTTNYPQQGFVSRLYGLNVGVEEQVALRMTIYPNPVSTNLTVGLERSVADGALVLSDAMGREVMRQRATAYYNVLDVGGLAAGLYTLGLYSKGQWLRSERVIVQR